MVYLRRSDTNPVIILDLSWTFVYYKPFIFLQS